MPYKDKEKQKKAQHEHYLRNKETFKQRVKERRNKRRQWWAEYKVENDFKCIKCEANHPAVLVFHHRDPSEKDFSVSRLISSQAKIELILEEIKKCDIFCANCHRILHWELRNMQAL